MENREKKMQIEEIAGAGGGSTKVEVRLTHPKY
jgi:hypothetical protein